MAKTKSTYEWPEGVTPERRVVIAQILWTIVLDGPFEDRQSGRTTARLIAALNKRRVRITQSWLTKTLNDLDEGGLFGQLIEREMAAGGRRTYSLRVAVDPYRSPFPVNPFRHTAESRRAAALNGPVTPVVAPDEDEIEDEPQDDETIEAELMDDDNAGDEVEDLDEPSRELVHLAEAPVSVEDRLIFASSVIIECVGELASQATRDFGAVLDQGLDSANRLVNKVVDLTDALAQKDRELEDARRRIRTLNNALNAANQIRTNGAERVPV